jgi:hypothetical protein
MVKPEPKRDAAAVSAQIFNLQKLKIALIETVYQFTMQIF